MDILFCNEGKKQWMKLVLLLLLIILQVSMHYYETIPKIS